MVFSNPCNPTNREHKGHLCGVETNSPSGWEYACPAAAAKPSLHAPLQAIVCHRQFCVQEVAGQDSRVLQVHSPTHPFSQNDLSEPQASGLLVAAPSSKFRAREPLVPGLGSSFCNFGVPALRAPLDLLLSHLVSDARKVGEMQGSSRETTGVRGYTQV